MQEISVKLFEGAYTLKPSAERRATLLAVLALVLQVSFLGYLSVSALFVPELVLVFAVNLVAPAYFFFNLWLDRRPKYSRHLTLTEQGVCYRSRFLQKEQEFDWEEIDRVVIEPSQVLFILKNEEEHHINLERIPHEKVVEQVKEQIREMVQQKEIMLR